MVVAVQGQGGLEGPFRRFGPGTELAIDPFDGDATAHDGLDALTDTW
jgi:hypothetical protein